MKADNRCSPGLGGFVFYFGRFVPRYFMIFDWLVNGITFLISLSDVSFLVLRDFCMLIFYSAILSNLLMSSNIFLVGSLV